MSTARSYGPVSVGDYLRGEQTAQRKHEYVDGRVYAMGGATNVHNRIATNGTVALGMQLRGLPCQVFNSDTKVRVSLATGTRFYYPDVSVVCRPNPPTDTFHEAPVVIIEVISESTRRFDEYEKREAYLAIQALSVYILVESYTAAVLVYRRGDSGFQRETYLGTEAVIPLPEVGCELRLAELYEDVEFAAGETDDQSQEAAGTQEQQVRYHVRRRD
jgi:Uma2 family endonuclease